MKKQRRRDFIKMTALAGGAAAVGGCATSASTAPAIAGDMAFGVLLHLGVHMWGDWTPDKSRIPNSPEELAKMYPDDKLNRHGVFPSRVTNYLRTDEAVWRSQTELVQAEGLNMVIIDLG